MTGLRPAVTLLDGKRRRTAAPERRRSLSAAVDWIEAARQAASRAELDRALDAATAAILRAAGR